MNLLTLTTFNRSDVTRKCLDTVRGLNGFDVILADDCSKDDTFKLSAEYNITILTKPEGKGCTDSWNMAYRYFKNGDYKNFFLMNNDILIPKGALEEMLKVLKDNLLVVPVTTKYGSGHAHKLQTVDTYHKLSITPSYSNYLQVQNFIQKADINPIKIPMFNGFAFAMNRGIIDYEFKENMLFNPKAVNVGNEGEFNARLNHKGIQATLCPKAFIYHFKDKTFKWSRHGVDRNNLEYYQKNWK